MARTYTSPAQRQREHARAIVLHRACTFGAVTHLEAIGDLDEQLPSRVLAIMQQLVTEGRLVQEGDEYRPTPEAMATYRRGAEVEGDDFNADAI